MLLIESRVLVVDRTDNLEEILGESAELPDFVDLGDATRTGGGSVDDALTGDGESPSYSW